MDAKSRANFINSVATGQNIPCPKCNTLNENNAKFCASCGFLLGTVTEQNNIPFSPIGQAMQAEKELAATKDIKVEKNTATYAEETSVFAEGLPAWDVLPPQVMVRRKKSI